MKHNIHLRTLAAATLLVTLGTTSAFASAKGTKTVLTENEWQAIEDESRIEGILQPIEGVGTTVEMQNPLELNLQSGTKTTLSLNAPFSPEEQVGLVVIAADGNVVYRQTGTYAEVQHFSFSPVFSWDETYVVRLYSASQVFETKVQVVYI